MTEEPRIVRYVSAIGRNPGEELGRSHLYAELDGGDYLPMCRWGWNRSDGAGFSIFRGHMGARGLCAICQRRREEGKQPVDAKPGSHKTRWI
jgi:hypothetical protein